MIHFESKSGDTEKRRGNSHPPVSPFNLHSHFQTKAMTVMQKAVQVGVGVLIMRQHKVLVGRRIGSHGAGM